MPGKRTLVFAGAIAGALGVSAMLIRRRVKEAERRYPPKGRFLNVDGVRLHYLDRGSGPPLLLVHGTGSSSEEIAISGLIDTLAERYRVLVFDRPGYGYSTRPFGIWTASRQAALLHRALAQIGVKRPIILGHSWAASLAMAYALAYPRDTRGVVLVSGYYYPEWRFEIAAFSTPAVPVLGWALDLTLSPWIARLMWKRVRKRLFAPSAATTVFETYPIELSLRPSQLRAAAEDIATLIPNALMLRHHYHELAVPAFILAGEGDLIVPTAAHSVRLHGELPNAQFRFLPQSGHMLHHVTPDEVLHAIEAVDAAAQVPA